MGTHMPHGITVLPAIWQRWHSCPYPSRSWYSIKRPRRDARLSWPEYWVGLCVYLSVSVSVCLGMRWVSGAGVTRRSSQKCPTLMRGTCWRMIVTETINRLPLFTSASTSTMTTKSCTGEERCWHSHTRDRQTHAHLTHGSCQGVSWTSQCYYYYYKRILL